MGIVAKPELYHYWSRNVMHAIFIDYLIFPSSFEPINMFILSQITVLHTQLLFFVMSYSKGILLQ